MAQTNNERELHLTKVLKLTALERAIELQSIHGAGAVDLGCLTVLQDMVEELKSPISQNEQQEAVATVKRVREIYPNEWFGTMDVDWEKLKDGDKLYTTLLKQEMPEGWVDTSISMELPANYKKVPAVHNGELKIMSHENGWWYGLNKGERPEHWCKLPSPTEKGASHG